MTLERLEALTEKLRALGVTEYEHDGVKLKLGPIPAPKGERMTLRDDAAERKKRRLQEEMLQFASVEGFYDIDDSMVDDGGEMQ